MNQILHIFKKDARRHWPEILISLALLGLFTRHDSTLGRIPMPSPLLVPFFSFSQVATSLRPRSFSGHSSLSESFKANPWSVTVNGGSLSPTGGGICWPPTPFHPHLHLCPAFSYAPPSPPSFRLPHPSQPLGPPRNATRPVLCTLSACVVVGEPHKKLWPALTNCCLYSLSGDRDRLVVHQISSGDMESPPAIVEHFQDLLLWGSVVAVPVWQFARRRRWVPLQFPWDSGSQFFDQRHSPNAKTLEKDYLPVEAQTSPAKIAIRQTTVTTGRRNANPWSDVTPDVRLSFQSLFPAWPREPWLWWT